MGIIILTLIIGMILGAVLYRLIDAKFYENSREYLVPHNFSIDILHLLADIIKVYEDFIFNQNVSHNLSNLNYRLETMEKNYGKTKYLFVSQAFLNLCLNLKDNITSTINTRKTGDLGYWSSYSTMMPNGLVLVFPDAQKSSDFPDFWDKVKVNETSLFIKEEFERPFRTKLQIDILDTVYTIEDPDEPQDKLGTLDASFLFDINKDKEIDIKVLFQNIIVERQNKGIGSLLVERLEYNARLVGASVITGEFVPLPGKSRDLARFYKRHGFEVTIYPEGRQGQISGTIIKRLEPVISVDTQNVME